jgi:hypothetical protein
LFPVFAVDIRSLCARIRAAPARKNEPWHHLK